MNYRLDYNLYLTHSPHLISIIQRYTLRDLEAERLIARLSLPSRKGRKVFSSVACVNEEKHHGSSASLQSYFFYHVANKGALLLKPALAWSARLVAQIVSIASRPNGSPQGLVPRGNPLSSSCLLDESITISLLARISLTQLSQRASPQSYASFCE